jgi:hypothetical protein
MRNGQATAAVQRCVSKRCGLALRQPRRRQAHIEAAHVAKFILTEIVLEIDMR